MENEFYLKKFDSESDAKLRDPLHAKAFLALLIITSLTLPATGILGFPVKHLVFILFLFVLLLKWMTGYKVEKSIIVLLIISCIFGIFFILTGALYGFSYFRHSLMESLQFLTTVAVGISILIAKSMRIADDEEIISYAFYGIFFYTIWKSTAGLLISIGIVSFESFYSFCRNVFDFVPVGNMVQRNLCRISYMSADFIATTFLFFISYFSSIFSGIPILFKRIFYITGIFCLVLSFSRILFVLAALFWIFIFFFKYSFKKRLVFVSFFLGVMIVGSYWAQDAFVWTKEIFEERFVSSKSKYNRLNDEIRGEQTEALINEWQKAPILGGGFGHYAKDYIRAQHIPFAYEVQWVGFLMKFGIFGISFLIFLVFLLFYGILKGKRSSGHYILASTLAFYIIGSFTNQYAFGSLSAIFYIIHINIASVLRSNMCT